MKGPIPYREVGEVFVYDHEEVCCVDAGIGDHYRNLCDECVLRATEFECSHTPCSWPVRIDQRNVVFLPVTKFVTVRLKGEI